MISEAVDQRDMLKLMVTGLLTSMLAMSAALAGPYDFTAALPDGTSFAPLPAASAKQADPWKGLTLGTEAFAVSGLGKGMKGGFGADGFLGYDHAFDNHVVLGLRASAGYLPGIIQGGPAGYNFGMVDARFGYEMGRLTPWVAVGGGVAKATRFASNTPDVSTSLNDLFSDTHKGATFTRASAGFDYAVNNNLTLGMSVGVMQFHNGFAADPLSQ